MRHDLRQEPYAIVPHMQICAGVPGNRRPYRNPRTCTTIQPRSSARPGIQQGQVHFPAANN